jgi:hypothetical protein
MKSPGSTPDAQMRALKAWAIERMTAGTQTPWAWFQFMKLLEVLDTFIEAGDEVEATSKPREAAKRTRAKPLAENVVHLDPGVRRRALD